MKSKKPKEVFCRIIELENHQVLLQRDYDTEEDSFTFVVTTQFDNIRPAMTHGYKSEKERDKIFNEYGTEHAEKFVQIMIDELSEAE